MITPSLAWLLRAVPVAAAAFTVLSARASEDAISCVKDMAVPSAYSSVYNYIPATVEVKVEIGPDGRARKIDYSTSVKALQLQLDGYFKTKARYLAACRGKTISFTVQYVVQGAALDSSDRRFVSCRPTGSLSFVAR
jgi:hypothetical protein